MPLKQDPIFETHFMMAAAPIAASHDISARTPVSVSSLNYGGHGADWLGNYRSPKPILVIAAMGA